MTTTPNKCTGLLTRVRRRAAAAVVAAICSLHAAGASAATISLGPQIDLAPDLFVVPVTITDGINVTAWQFDLRYDPLDLQVNLACDPFSSVAYCSLFTGPVTEGDFFASGSPFNLLNPGFVAMDPTTLAQTGLLFAVSGARISRHRPGTSRSSATRLQPANVSSCSRTGTAKQCWTARPVWCGNGHRPGRHRQPGISACGAARSRRRAAVLGGVCRRFRSCSVSPYQTRQDAHLYPA
jgi:hypothetical protein